MLDWLRSLFGVRKKEAMEKQIAYLKAKLEVANTRLEVVRKAEQQREASLQDRARGCRLEIWQDKASEFRWRLKSRNHCIIAESGEGYKRMENLEKSLALVCDVIEIAERKKP